MVSGGLVQLADKHDPLNDEVATGATADQDGGQLAALVISVSTGFDAQVIKASAGRLYGYIGWNFDATKLAFVKFYNKATAPDPSADAALLLWTHYIHPGAATASDQRSDCQYTFPHGLAFSNGIALVLTQGAGVDETAVDAGDVVVQLTYK